MLKRIISLLLITTLVLSTLSACSKGQVENKSTDTQQQTESNSEGDKKTGEKVTLRYMWWGGDSRHEATLKAIEKYEALNPNVDIEPEYMGWDGYYEKLVTQLASGTAADLMQIDVPWLVDLLAEDDLFVNLYESETVNIENFDKVFLEDYVEYDGKLVGIPMGINALTVFVNTNLFEEIGMDYDYQWTWEDMLTVGTDVNQKYPDKYLVNMNIEQLFDFVLRPYLYQKNGNQFIDSSKNLGFTEEELVEVITYIDNLYKGKVLQPIEESILYFPSENPTWIEGNMGLQFEWPPTLYNYDTDNTEIDVMMIPKLEQAKASGIVMKATMLTSVNAYSEHKDEALAFLNWYANDEEAILAHKDVRGVPASLNAQDILVNNDLLNPLMARAVSNGLANPFEAESAYCNNSEVSGVCEEILEMVAYEEITPQEAAKEMIERLQEVLQ